MGIITRKCSICKQKINILEEDNYFYVIKKRDNSKLKTYTHDICYIKYHTEEKQRLRKTVDECNEYIKNQKENMLNDICNKNTKENLYDFIADMYDISYFPKKFYIKMATIFNGTYKGMTKMMQPEDLFDMWKQKKNMLNKIAENNKKKGNIITGINRVNYDLAILLSKYDSYLQWKEKQKLAFVEDNKRENNNNQKIINNNIFNIKKENEKLNDISSLIDEI